MESIGNRCSPGSFFLGKGEFAGTLGKRPMAGNYGQEDGSTESKLYPQLQAAIKAILNNEMWPDGSADNKRILILEWKGVFVGVGISIKWLWKIFGGGGSES